jgi:hypothetical protein
MTSDERRRLFYTNNALLRQAPNIVSEAMKNGWISPPNKPLKKFNIGMIRRNKDDQEE